LLPASIVALFLAAAAIAARPVEPAAHGARMSHPTASQQPPAQGSAPQQQPPQQQPPQQQPPQQQPPQQSGAQQQPPERAPQPPIRTGINFVRVDVIVSDREGRPVLDLKPEEFSVSEDGKPQKIETFSVIKIDQASQADAPAPMEIRSRFDEEREAARPDVRLFIILLDDYHVRRGNDMSVRKPLIDFIQNQLAPADMVAVMYPLTPVRDLTFTRNRDSLISAIEKFEGRRFNYLPRNEFEERYAYYPAATVERIRNQVVMDAIKGAAVKLGGMREGRKSIVLVSEGFTNNLPPQLNDPVAAMPGLGNTARGRSDVAASDRAEFMNNVDMFSELQEIFVEANRNNTSIYAVDPRGLAAFEYDINQNVGLQVDRKHLDAALDTLRALADNTDGRAIINRNDLASGMKQIIRDSSGYYLIGYNSTQAPTDGKFHEIKVRVTRRGVDVRARKGYWAYTAEDAARANAPAKPEVPADISAALSTIAEPVRGRPARFWLGTSRGENGRTKVTFAWEPVPAAPGETRATDEAPARVSLTALAADGRPVFRGRVPEEISPPAAAGTDGAAGAAPQPAQSAGSIATFEAPPGNVQVRIVVEGGRGQVLDSVTRELTLPDFTSVEVSFSTPQVYRARTVRDIQNIRKSAAGVPTADRAFARTDRLFIRTSTYAPGNAVPAVTAQLLNRSGDKMADVPVQTPAPGGADVDLPLSNLAPGDYLLQLTAKTETGTARELVAFRVGR
jgi:VWFA-related protein